MLVLSLIATLLGWGFLHALANDVVLQNQLTGLAVLGGLAWLVYTRLPEALRRHVRPVMRKGSRDHQ
jgi:hypothetical protein